MTPIARLGLIGAVLAVGASSAAQSVTFTIDPTQGVQPISPYIYGANASLSQTGYSSLNLTSERLGGNRWTAYNWTTNASNAGSDYMYSNDNYLSSSTVPGAAVQPTLQDAASRNAATIITIPTAGYVSADESGPVNPSIPPAQSPHFVPSYPTMSTDPNPAANHVYQDQFLSWVKTNFPAGFTAGSTAPIFVSLDNEPDLWSSTHPEVHPKPATYAELVQKTTAYSTALKAVAPNVLIYGPVSYGWEGYLTLQNAPDSSADNSAINPATGKAYGDFLSYYLAQMKSASQSAGERLLDVLDVHWYPEATGPNASGTQTRITNQDNSPGVAAARVQAPRSLWDPTYVETSWITQDTTGGKAIQLLPRLQGEINTNYAGTKLSVSEYNYGGATDISGAIAEADVLGIFGKYGVFSANEWPLASKEPFILGAMAMYRNYDGHGSTFGDTSISATNTDIQDTSIYASKDSATGRMTLVAINKTGQPISTRFTLNNTSQTYTSFAVYQLTSASTIVLNGTVADPAYLNTYPISALSNFSLAADSVSTIVPLPAAPAGTIYDWNTTAASTSASDWTAGANWNPLGSPGFGVADIARFGQTATIAAGNTVNLNGNQKIAEIINKNANAWTLAPGTPGTSTLTLNEITQSSAAPLTISAAIAADGTNQLKFDGSGGGAVTVTGAVSGNAAQAGLLQLTKSSSDKLELDGGLALANNSTLAVNAGTLKISVATGSPNVGTGVMATVSSGATLELAGAVSALGAGTVANRASITNNSAAAGGGLLVSGGNQAVGAVTGGGTTMVSTGASLTASHIIQSALAIGGTSSQHALVTIDASDSEGNPLADALTRSGDASAAELLPSSDQFVSDGNQLKAASVSAADADPAEAVPEPSSLTISWIGAVAAALGFHLSLTRQSRRRFDAAAPTR